MKNTIKLIAAVVLLFSCQLAHAQKGILKGTIKNEASGETIIGASIMIPGTSTGTRSDVNGNFTLKLNPGTQKIKISFVSFEAQTKEVNIQAGKTTTMNVSMKQRSRQTKMVVIKTERIKNSEKAMLTLQRKSTNVMDGASAETFKKTGDNDAAVAMSRVTGVSVEGGKYIYVRGLGDRYSKSQLNGVDIPGLDPDRNTVQMDIFPTNLLDNIVVYKTFSPNLPGDFTGGMVNVETKSFVRKKTIGFSSSLGFTPGMNINSEALTYQAGFTDYLGFGNVTRKLPLGDIDGIPSRSSGNDRLTILTKKFNPQLAPSRFTSPLNGSVSFSKGNQIKKGKSTIGFNTALNYRYQFRHYDEYEIGRSIKDGDKSINDLTVLSTTMGERSEQEISWSALAGGALKRKNSKYVVNLLHTQNAVSRAAIYDTRFPNGFNTALPLKQYVLDYSQRSVSNVLFSGRHELKNKWKIDWKLSPTYSRIVEPDIRSTTYLIENGGFQLDNGDGAIPERFYRSLNEVNAVAKFDVKRAFKLKNDKETTLSFGMANTIKNRDYEVLRFIFNNTMAVDWEGNGNEVLEDENLWRPSNKRGTYVRTEESLTKNPNVYNATQNIAAAYVMNEFPISDKLKAIGGVRAEKTDMWISGYGRFEGEEMDENKYDERVMNALDILPALNLIYNLKEKTNLRFSYSRTLARPSFKEKSFVSILDPLSNVRFIGNIGLKRTNINNVDARFENFFGLSEMISFSAFYKHFTNPIEISSFLLEPNDITPRNAGTAHLIGGELELRKNLGFLGNQFKRLSFNTNITLVQSYIDMREIIVEAGQDRLFGTADDVNEFESRSANLRDGQELGFYRPMFGQSPFVVNSGINYTNDSLGYEMQVSYNVQGKRLAVVGVGARPDVYNQAFHSLNAKASKLFGKKKQWKTSLTVRNILNQKRQQFFESYQAAPQVFEAFSPGTSISIGINYLLQ